MAKIVKLRLIPPGKKLSEVSAAVNTLTVLVSGLLASVETSSPGTKRQMAMVLRHIASAVSRTAPAEHTAAYKEAIRILTEE